MLKYIKTYFSDISTREVVLKLKKMSPETLDKLDEETKKKILKTSDSYSNKARLYLAVLDKYSIVCKKTDCNCQTKFDNDKNVFRKYCSVKCRNTDKNIREKISSKWTADKIKKKNEKTIKTNLRRYGVTNTMMLNDVRTKVINTNIRKYGASSATYKHFKNIENYNKEYIENNFLKDDVLDISGLVKYFNLSKSNINKRMNYFDIQYNSSLVSSYEQEVANYIRSLEFDIIQSSRSHISPLELDIVVPEYNIAIEFNGLYWHSFGNLNVNQKQGDLNYNKNRHLIKTNKCIDKNLQLFHIFEDEWIDPIKKNIWKSMLNNALNLTKLKYRGSDCEIREVSREEARQFLTANHMQGSVNSSVRLGLYKKNDLVSLMTFGKSRYSNDEKVIFELLRFCNLTHTMTHGAGTKLLNYFKNNYTKQGDKLVSYANQRWSNGNFYRAMGFDYIKTSRPNHFIFKRNGLESRITYQKHKLKNITDFDFDNSLTAFQNLVNNGYRIIFDAGNKVYIKTFRKNK